MRVFRIVILILLVAVVLSFVFTRTNSAQTGTLQELQDRSNIQSLIVRYGTALDTLDADGYAGVFTEDAELDVAGPRDREGRRVGDAGVRPEVRHGLGHRDACPVGVDVPRAPCVDREEAVAAGSAVGDRGRRGSVDVHVCDRNR